VYSPGGWVGYVAWEEKGINPELSACKKFISVFQGFGYWKKG